MNSHESFVSSAHLDKTRKAPTTFDPCDILVLNVDDHEPARYAKSRILSLAGYRILEAVSGGDALDKARQNNPDVVLLDVNMPDIDGFEVCRKLKADHATANIPVIQVSASFVSTSDQAEGLDGGADAFLTAPTDPKVLLGTVRAMTRIRLAERELQISLERERQARAEAERLGRAKDEFLATLSHELRTPLNVMIGWANLLKQKVHSPDEVAKGIEVIERNAKLQANLISDLLDVSRILAGKTELNLRSIPLHNSVTSAIEAIRPGADAKRITISLVMPPDPINIQADQNRLQQILWNLLSNAVKFTPKGGRIECSICTRDRHGVVHIKDTGTGISSDFLPFVFERFRQADSSLARSQGGLGLGLAIVKHLTSLHQGTICVSSDGIGKGSEFVVSFPLVNDGLRPGLLESETPASVKNSSTPNLSGVSVLVIDDELDGLEASRLLLSQYGANVITASSANEGERLLGDLPVQVIVSDIGMPGKDGYQFLKGLRNSGNLVPAVALTAFAHDSDRLDAFRAGYQAHIAKPFDPYQLATVVSRLSRVNAL